MTVQRLTGIRGAASAHGLSAKGLSSLAHAGVLPAYEAAGGLYVRNADVADLAARSHAPGGGPAIVVRVEIAKPTEDGTRSVAGWSQDLPLEERRAGVDRWWRVNDKRVPLGTYFVVTLAGLIVECGPLRAVLREDPIGGYARVEVDWGEGGNAYPVGHWLPTGRGGPLIYLNC